MTLVRHGAIVSYDRAELIRSANTDANKHDATTTEPWLVPLHCQPHAPSNGTARTSTAGDGVGIAPSPAQPAPFFRFPMGFFRGELGR